MAPSPEDVRRRRHQLYLTAVLQRPRTKLHLLSLLLSPWPHYVSLTLSLSHFFSLLLLFFIFFPSSFFSLSPPSDISRFLSFSPSFPLALSLSLSLHPFSLYAVYYARRLFHPNRDIREQGSLLS